MGKVIDLVTEKIVPVIEGLGYEVVEVSYEKGRGAFDLTFFIHKPGGSITLDDCEAVSRAVDGPLDELDPTAGAAYNLNVSSPGLDRPIKTDKDFARAIGSEVDVKLYAAVDKKKNYTGVLKSKTGDAVVLDAGGKEILLALNNIAKVTPHIKFE